MNSSAALGFVNVLHQRRLAPGSPILGESVLGATTEVRSRANNLLGHDLSVGRSSEGLKATSPLSLDGGPGWAGDGAIIWEPTSKGDAIEIELPEVVPADYLRGDGTGMFVAMCLSARVQTDVALNLYIEGQTEDDAEATPGFVAADPANWQRIATAVRANDTDKPRGRLVALTPGRVRIDGLQLDPRPYPVWMVGEPMRTGMWGPWTEGGTEREDDRLWAELGDGDIAAAGTIALWCQPDWPSSEFPHVLFDVDFDVLSCFFNNGRLIGSAGGSQAWVYGATDWRYMMAFAPGRWHHVALTWDTDGEVGLYVNGECYCRRQTPKAMRLDPTKLGRRLHLGCPSQDEGFQEQPDMPGRFDGLLADVRIYREALDDAGVAAVHFLGRQKLEKGPTELVDVRLEGDELVTESTFYRWFPNKIGKMFDGSVEVFCGGAPDYGLKRPAYWPKHRFHFRKSSPDDTWQEFSPRWCLGRQPIRLPDGRWFSWAIDMDRPPKLLRQDAFGAYVVSADGEQWEPFDGELSLPDNESHTVSQFITDSSGRVLICGSIRLKGSEKAEGSIQDSLFGPLAGQSHLYIAESKDSGKTFQFLSLITEGQRPAIGDYCEENALIEVLPDGPREEGTAPELLLVGRIRGHQVPCIQTRSLDGGRTWSALEFCPFGAVFPRMVRLENGVIMLLTGRPETVLHWTTDGGRTWSAPSPLYDSREQPAQSENIWYGPSTGYGALAEIEPNRLWASYDRLGAYDASEQKRTNQIHVCDVRVERVRGTRRGVPLGEFGLRGGWRILDGEVAWVDNPEASAELEFEGTGIALVHPVLRHGGHFRASIDGETVREVSCYDCLPHHAISRTILATGLKPGPHQLVLSADLSSKERHAHGDGAELSGILSWLHLAHCRSDRWVGICGAEVISE